MTTSTPIANQNKPGAKPVSAQTRLVAAPWPELGVLLVAAIARFWRLGYHSVWFDEAVSLKWASSDASYIWQVSFPLLQDKHPPFYYLLLHYWQALLEPLGAATSDAALRSIGALLGVLTVAGVLWLASSLGSRTVGLLAGLLVALSPILVWYSQELRMFQPATTGLVWAAVALMQTWKNDARSIRYWWWLLFILALIASLYTYLFSAFMLPAVGLMLALFAYQKRSWRLFAEGVLAMAIVAAAFMPLAYNAWIVNGSESTPGVAFEHFFANTQSLIQNFTFWRVPWPESVKFILIGLYTLLAIVGLALPYPVERDARRLWRLNMDQAWLLVWLLTPLIIANVLLSRSRSVFSEDRYLLFMAPFLLWAIARGVAALGVRIRYAGWVAGTAVVIPLLVALPSLWTPDMARENWRAAADYILKYHEVSGLPDTVIAHLDYTHLPLEWYLRKEHTFDELPVFFPFGGALQPEDMETVVTPPLNGLVDFGTETAWLTQSHLERMDEQHLVEQWFNDRYPLVTEQYPAGVKLSAYEMKYRYSELPALGENAVIPGS